MLIQLNAGEYAKITAKKPLWQSLDWKTYQEALGRETRLYGLKTPSGKISAAALVIVDKTSFGLSTWDIPRGPAGADDAMEDLIKEIKIKAMKNRCMALYFSPPTDIACFRNNISSRREQPEATVILDLRLPDAEMLSQMKQKCRYNIRLAEKNGVRISESRDAESFYGLLKKTGKRGGFRIKPKSHYDKFLSSLPGSFLLLAYKDKKTIAGLLAVIHNGIGYYYYGASDYECRNLMAPYLLQWEAIRRCRELGCREYDLLGISGRQPEPRRRDPWAGITRFKTQFGGEILTYPPEKEIVLMPAVKKLIDWKRKFQISP